MIVSPLSVVRALKDTPWVWMSARATPAARSAAMTFRISVAFAARAAVAVFALLTTPKLKAARLGTVVTEPAPVTDIVFAAGEVSLRAPSGAPIPANAAITARTPAANRRRFILTALIRRRSDGGHTLGSCRRGRGGAERVEIRAPARRNLGRGKADEEDRRRWTGLPPQRHRDLLREPVALAE